MAKKRKSEYNREKDVTKIEQRPFETRNIAEIGKEWLQLGGANINIARIAPNIIDGLRPVWRRALFSMHEGANQGLKFRKVQVIGSNTMLYHPHGDSSVFNVIYTMGQPWSMNIPFIDSQGNFGSASGDEPAAPRYPDAKMSREANWIFFSNFKDSNVPMRPTYNGESKEPDYLPARIPMVLCNPQFSGIGIGVTSNIPPFNPTEVVDATIKLIKNPKAKILLLPDSPTGCNIVDNGCFQDLNDYGYGEEIKVMMQATYTIDYIKNIVTITSLPLQVTVEQIVASIIGMRKNGDLKDLIDITDESKELKVKLNFVLKSDANPDEFIDQILKKKTNLRKSFGVELRVIDDLKPRVWGTKRILLEWIEYYRECTRAIYNKKLMDAVTQYHMNEIYLFVFSKDNLSRTIKIAKSSKNREEMAARFKETYKITSIQADTLAKLSVQMLSKESYEGFKEAKVTLNKLIDKYEEILSSDAAVDKVIIADLKEYKEKFPHPRRSAIIKLGKDPATIPNTMHLIGISRDGYIKKISLEERKSIGYVGKSSQVMVTMVNNRDNLLIFDSTGRLSRVGVSSIPDMDYNEIGVELTRYFTLGGTPVSVFNESSLKDDDGDVMVITECGIGKRIRMSEFAKIKDYKTAIQLNEGDSLVTASPSGDDEQQLIIYTNFGDGIRLKVADIRRQSKTAKGSSLIKLRHGESVTGVSFLEGGCNKILYVTSNGRMKLTQEKFFPLMNRKDEPLSLIGLEANECLVGLSFVSSKDSVRVYRKKSEPIDLAIKDIPITTRAAKAIKLVKIPRGDIVTGFSVMRK